MDLISHFLYSTIEHIYSTPCFKKTPPINFFLTGKHLKKIPMKYLSLLVLLTCLSIQFGFSQVKKQYLDNKNTRSTVVVKEDNASDMDILNSQFDINSIGLGQEIRIKTEKDSPKPNFGEVLFAEVPLAEVPLAEVPANVVTPKGGEVGKNIKTKKVVQKTATKKRMPARAVAVMPRVKKKPTEIYYKGIGKSSTKKVKMKKRKLVKRKKISKRKRRKIRCYSF